MIKPPFFSDKDIQTRYISKKTKDSTKDEQDISQEKQRLVNAIFFWYILRKTKTSIKDEQDTCFFLFTTYYKLKKFYLTPSIIDGCLL